MPDVSPLSTPSPSPPRERARARDGTRERNHDRDGTRERNHDRDGTRQRNHDRDGTRERYRERERERDADRTRAGERDHAKDGDADRDSTLRGKRLSITDRIRGTFGQARKDNAAVPRRASTSSASAAKQSPIARIREWLDICNTGHGTHCADHEETDVGTWRPGYLVDCAERRLVHAKPTDRYAALSYVPSSSNPRHSGPDAQSRLLKANVDAYLTTLADKAIPQTILDAIWLTKKLGIRHLWVDSLCIVQDDDKHTMEHMEHMAYVFSRAYLTIAVAHGDAHTGILALDPRRPLQTPKEGHGEHDELLQASRWNATVWTLQERLYARRAVFFFEDTTTWACHCDVWQGATTSMTRVLKGKKPVCTRSLSGPALGYRHAPWPDLDEYARIVMDYSVRRVTLVDDTVLAFAGITHVLSRIFRGGFACGLPTMFLDVALLWRPQATIRRRPSSRSVSLPSWSWMGWWSDGIPVDVVLWRAAAADCVLRSAERGPAPERFRGTHPFRIKPLVRWSLSDGAKSVPVADNGLHLRELRSRRNASALPRGWTRSGGGFRHESDALTTFKYPVPVVDESSEDAAGRGGARDAPAGPLLLFRTRCAFLDVDYAISMAPRDRPGLPIAVGNIWGKAGQWIGEFRAHDGWLGVQSSNYDGEEKLEFVAVSGAMERRGSHVFPMDRFEENMDEEGVVHFVNVLWIERIAGVAFRRGVGHVVQKVWDADARDEVDVYLG